METSIDAFQRKRIDKRENKKKRTKENACNFHYRILSEKVTTCQVSNITTSKHTATSCQISNNTSINEILKKVYLTHLRWDTPLGTLRD